jgi:hypothetical protein
MLMEAGSGTVRTGVTFMVDRIRIILKADRIKGILKAGTTKQTFKVGRFRATFKVDEAGSVVIFREVVTTTEADTVASSADSAEDDAE